MPHKTLLLLPPRYRIDFPPLGTPALLGFLRSRGRNASQWDLNHEYARRMASKLRLSGDAPAGALDDDDRGVLFESLANDIFAEKARSDVYYAKLLENTFSRAAYNDWTTSSYAFAENILESEHLERFLEDEDENMFLQFYREAGVVGRIESAAADLLGFSIIGPSQIIPTLTLAKLLKRQRGGSPRIVIGGQWPTLYFEQLCARPDLGRWIDFIVRGEGETPLLQLAEADEGALPLAEVPNLAYAAQGGWKTTSRSTKEDMSKLPAPDFDGMPVGQYLTDEPGSLKLTFETSRECYWNRCTYCVDLPMPHEGYRIKPIDLLIRDIVELKENHGCGYLEVSDPAIAPKRLRDLSSALIEKGLKIPFWCFARLEKNFTKELFELASRAGMVGIAFGMETANQRIMDMVDKGTRLDECRRIIRDAAESGIAVNLQIILRLPTEKYEEGLETVHFLVENKRWINQAVFNIYYLTPGNLIYLNPRASGIRILPGQPKFRFFQLFENLDPETMTYEQAEELIRLYDVLMRPLEKRALGATKPPIETVNAGGPVRVAEGLRIVGCELELCGVSSQRDLCFDADGEHWATLSRGESALLRRLGDGLPDLARLGERDHQRIQGLLNAGILHPAATPQAPRAPQAC